MLEKIVANMQNCSELRSINIESFEVFRSAQLNSDHQIIGMLVVNNLLYLIMINVSI